ncbi:hypothetical protein NUW58_g870 [Xylaria curta]|uniref:Uncharacterized protein n=1 Tax=Xylaria curta TaxID=42375 RepID=A0ACC1PNT1_9PEZI|nr:hypothetical protein NUW58_g870 [Xylaria curta]
MAELLISSLTHEAREKAKKLQIDGDNGRRDLLKIARALVAALETPKESVMRMTWHSPTVFAAMRLCMDLDLYSKICDDDGSPKSAQFLAETTGADPRLVERLLKHLATANIVSETAADVYGANSITQLLATTQCSGMVISVLSEFFQLTGWRNPVDKSQLSPFSFAANVNMTFYDWIFQAGNESHAEAFHRHMEFKTMDQKWHDTIPLDQILGSEDSCRAEDVLLVDVGGNKGTIEEIDFELLGPVEAMAHDFFMPQPVSNARAYYMKMVLHNWDDDACVKIMTKIRLAMTPGYSKILVNEVVIPDTRVDWFATSVDFMMLTTQSTEERKRENGEP